VTDAAFAKPVALFATLDSIVLHAVRAAARTKAIEAGQTFFREGDPAAAFFVLDRGSVKLTQLTPEGHQVVLRLLSPGDAFGGVAAFGGATYPITAEAVADASAYEWPGEVRARGQGGRHEHRAGGVASGVDRRHSLDANQRRKT
jgi:CRP-like cAMP-binding protein